MGLLIAIGVGLALALLAYDRIQQAKTRRDEPTCGQCGYCVRGIPSLICPECGSDLREVGILVPFRLPNPHLRLFTHLLIWTLLVPLPVVYFLDLFSNVLLPLRSTATETGQIYVGTDRSQPPIQVRLMGQSVGIGKATKVKVTTLTLMTFTHYPHDEPLTVDVASRICAFVDANTKTGMQSNELSSGAIGQWLASQGLTAARDSNVDERNKEIFTIVNAMMNSDMTTLQQFQLPRIRNIPMRGDRGRNPIPATSAPAPATTPIVTAMIFNLAPNITTDRIFWTYPVLLGVPAMIWLGGAYVLFRRARRSAQRVPVAA